MDSLLSDEYILTDEAEAEFLDTFDLDNFMLDLDTLDTEEQKETDATMEDTIEHEGQSYNVIRIADTQQDTEMLDEALEAIRIVEQRKSPQEGPHAGDNQSGDSLAPQEGPHAGDNQSSVALVPQADLHAEFQAAQVAILPQSQSLRHTQSILKEVIRKAHFWYVTTQKLETFCYISGKVTG